MRFLRSLRRRVPATAEYEFSTDWFTGNVYLFERNLGHLKGTPCRILEIGSFEGRSTIWMLENLATHPEARITSVDPKVRPTFATNIEKSGRSRKLTHVRRPSGDVLGALPRESFDFIYVDGSHAKIDVLEDAVLAFRLAKPEGIIAFDDYLDDSPCWNEHDFAKPAIDAFLGVYAERIEILERCHQIWIRKLPDPGEGE